MKANGNFRHELRVALVGGSVTALVLFGTIIGVGRVASFEALRLIEAALPSAHFLAAAVVGSSVTVLALLLTLLGLSLGSEYEFSPMLYVRARYITTLSVASIVLGTLILLAVTIPIGEVEELGRLYAVFYWALAASLAILGGLVVANGLLIGVILRGLIAIGHPEGDSDLVEDSERAAEEEEARRRRETQARSPRSN